MCTKGTKEHILFYGTTTNFKKSVWLGIEYKKGGKKKYVKVKIWKMKRARSPWMKNIRSVNIIF